MGFPVKRIRSDSKPLGRRGFLPRPLGRVSFAFLMLAIFFTLFPPLAVISLLESSLFVVFWIGVCVTELLSEVYSTIDN